MATMRVTCPLCRDDVELTMRPVSQDNATALVRVDTAPFVQHLSDCNQAAASRAAGPALRDSLAPAPGRRACTMCSTPNSECMTATKATRSACCSVCGDGNTHPTPRESMSCADWGAEHGADV